MSIIAHNFDPLPVWEFGLGYGCGCGSQGGPSQDEKKPACEDLSRFTNTSASVALEKDSHPAI